MKSRDTGAMVALMADGIISIALDRAGGWQRGQAIMDAEFIQHPARFHKLDKRFRSFF